MRRSRGALLCAALLGLALLFASFVVRAATPIVLEADHQPQRLLGAGDAWLDPSGKLPVEAIVQDKEIGWKPITGTEIFPLAKDKALWLRFTVRANPTAFGDRWYLEVPHAAVDRVTLYTQMANGTWRGATAGDLLPVSQWPVPHRHPLLPLAADAGSSQTYFVKVENSHSFSAPLQFVSESYQSLGEQQIALMLGIYFGLAALAFVMAVLSAISLKDLGFALYAATVLAMTLTQAALTGIGGLHLWGELPWWNDMAPFVLPVMAGGCMCGFVAEVVSVRERWPLLHTLAIGIALASIPLIVGILMTDAVTRFRLMLPFVVAIMPFIIFILLWALRRGDRYAGWILAGNIPVAIGALFPVMRTAGMIPATFWTMHSMQFGLALELPILMVMLLRRSQQRRDFIRRVKGIDRIDPATGLLNAAVFQERLVRLIARSVRLKYRSAILLVDITNLDQIRRDFDRQAAQELPLRVAGRLLSAAREIDSVARLSDHRFGLLLEGPLKADEVAEAAPRVVARCLMPFRNRPLGWSAQVKVAQALIPMDGTDPDQLIGQLEALLASASQDSKRAVFNLSRPGTLPPRPLATS
ncbi:diguanylate cyclase [Ramlibacter sp. XY19]|uniref:sensor domain-containing diguanylate cyclase n=1 Tax=Ramlibacter paludis TaxID=2908000 RepID=UPI0023DC4010|nr:7TM diverse intracellular signaling domain-containing protein [Ramlibacter paludis]MCG2595371.1 diguanylate cyclase [Ramlibacter paludis]